MQLEEQQLNLEVSCIEMTQLMQCIIVCVRVRACVCTSMCVSTCVSVSVFTYVHMCLCVIQVNNDM